MSLRVGSHCLEDHTLPKKYADIIVPEGGENLVALEMILGRVEKHIAAQPPVCGAGEDGAV